MRGDWSPACRVCCPSDVAQHSYHLVSAELLMPKTAKGRKIHRAMRRTYGKKADRVFYASANAGTISGVHRKRVVRSAHKSGTVKRSIVKRAVKTVKERR